MNIIRVDRKQKGMILMKNNNILYFEGAGWDYKSNTSDIENYRNLLSQAEIDKLSLEDQNSELQRQISVLKDIKLSSMEEKLNKTIDLLLELKPAIVENRILTKAVGRKVGGMISGDTNIEKWIADEKDKEQI